MTQPGEAFADSIYSELEEVKGLIARGVQVGVLTYAEIVAATAELGLDDSDVEELHGLLERCENRAGRGDRSSYRGEN